MNISFSKFIVIFKKKQKRIEKNASNFQVNEWDNDGVGIVKIYSKYENEVIYRTKNAIRMYVVDGTKNEEMIKENHLKINKQLADIYSILPEKLDKTESINRLIARAINTNMWGNIDDAKDILSEAKIRLTSLKILKGRLTYTVSSFFVVILFLILSIFFVNPLIKISLCGAIGAAMSVATGFASIEVDLDASQLINSLIGCSRIFLGIAAAIFLYFAVKSDIVFSFIAKCPDQSGFYMIAMVSGFIEKLVPNIMANLAKDPSVTTSQASGSEITRD
jgi:hypothetical protein